MTYLVTVIDKIFGLREVTVLISAALAYGAKVRVFVEYLMMVAYFVTVEACLSLLQTVRYSVQVA